MDRTFWVPPYPSPEAHLKDTNVRMLASIYANIYTVPLYRLVIVIHLAMQ
jgi:hypothetical protein